VPFAPGGSTDILRAHVERLSASPSRWWWRTAPAWRIGAMVAKRLRTAAMATTGVMAINNALYKNMTYDAAKDLEPVVYVASITNVLIVPPDFPAKNDQTSLHSGWRPPRSRRM
jgi:tripartite-type tricarboxylate transporter receptor subunit TctC